MIYYGQPGRSAPPAEETLFRKSHELIEIEDRRLRKTANSPKLH